MNATPAKMVECPKCFGCGVTPHRHVEGGVCFLCGGDKRVTERAAFRWLGSQHDWAPALSTSTKESARPALPTKSVELGEFGRVLISRFEDGTFSVRGVVVDDVDYWLCFSVINGRVKVNADLVQCGMVKHWRRVERALQAALRA